jgi:hypothetical protein
MPVRALVSAVISVPKQDSARVPTWAVQNTLVRASAAEFRAAGVQGGAAFGGNAALSGHAAAQGGAGFDDRRDVRSTNNASDRAAVGDSVVGANGATNMNIQGGFSNSTAAGFSGPLGGVSVDEQTAVGGGAAFGAGGSGLGSAGVSSAASAGLTSAASAGLGGASISGQAAASGNVAAAGLVGNESSAASGHFNLQGDGSLTIGVNAGTAGNFFGEPGGDARRSYERARRSCGER